MKYVFSVLVLFVIVTSCEDRESGNIDTWKAEILETERSFAAMAQKEGVPAAFMEYADDDAVLLRNNQLIIGKHELDKYYKKQDPGRNVSLTWEPEFIEVSMSGDMAYTYGYYRFSYVDSTDNKVENTGVFHTIWKKQPDGSWKFVWD